MRHSTQSRSPFLVRLACVKHAASVQSEPESNSPVQICTSILAFAKIGISKSFFPLAIHLSMNHPGHFRPARMMLMHPSARPVNYFFCFPIFFLAKTSSTRRELPFCITSPPLSSLFSHYHKITTDITAEFVLPDALEPQYLSILWNCLAPYTTQCQCE